MNKGKPLRIDATKPENLKPILSKPLILSSYMAGWKGLYLGYHTQLATYSIPESCPAQHIISIYTNDFQARLKINGKWQSQYYAVGDVGIFPANQISPAVQFESESGFIHLGLERAILASISGELVDIDEVEISQHLQTQDLLIQQIGVALKRELETSGVDSRLYAESAANMLAVHLLKRYSTRQGLIREYTGGLPKHKLKLAIAYIQENLSQSLSLEEIANVLQMSSHYFATLFKQSMGISPHQYITQCRVEEAKNLLANSELSIIQISQKMGIHSQSHFAKVFRKYTGTTPQGYRKLL